MWKTTRLDDKNQILSYLGTDRLYAAYAIGDLEPGMYEQCAWAGAERGAGLEALVLHYRGLEPPPLFLMGKVDGLRAILDATLCPERVYLTCVEQHLPLTREFYRWGEMTPMWRMVLQRASFQPASVVRGRGAVRRLGLADVVQLADLYTLGGGGAFSSAQVEQGVFFGVWIEDRLVAAAGTHLVSLTYGVGAVGNVFTHPDHRGHGYASAATSAVTAALLDHNIPDVVLNVGRDNAAALHVYEKLGFARYCPFLEGPAIKREQRRRIDDEQHLTGGRRSGRHLVDQPTDGGARGRALVAACAPGGRARGRIDDAHPALGVRLLPRDRDRRSDCLHQRRPGLGLA